MQWWTPCRWCRQRGSRAANGFPDGQACQAAAASARAKDQSAWGAASRAAPRWCRPASSQTAIARIRSGAFRYRLVGDGFEVQFPRWWLDRFGGRLGQQPAQIGKRCTYFVTMDHHIHHPVILEIFGALKSFGQLFANGLLDDARPRKADQRTFLRNVDIPEHCIR